MRKTIANIIDDLRRRQAAAFMAGVGGRTQFELGRAAAYETAADIVEARTKDAPDVREHLTHCAQGVLMRDSEYNRIWSAWTDVCHHEDRETWKQQLTRKFEYIMETLLNTTLANLNEACGGSGCMQGIMRLKDVLPQPLHEILRQAVVQLEWDTIADRFITSYLEAKQGGAVDES